MGGFLGTRGGGGGGGQGDIPPVWNESGILPEAKVGALWGANGAGYQLKASGTPPPRFYVYSGDTPPGFAMSSDGQIDAGPFNTVGTYVFTLVLENGTVPVTKDFTLVVSAATTNADITTTAGRTHTIGSLLDFQYQANGTLPIVWSKTAGTFPTNVDINSSGRLLGDPPASAKGVYNYTVQASNAAIGGASDTLADTLTLNLPPSITTNSLANLIANAAWSGTLGFDGYPTPTITATLANGSALPGTLAVSSAGVFSGTYGTQGTIDILFTATNSVGTTTRTLSLTIQASAGTQAPCPGSVFSWNNNGITTPINKVQNTEILAFFDLADGITNFNRAGAKAGSTNGPLWDDTEKATMFRNTPWSSLGAAQLALGTFPHWRAYKIKFLSTNPAALTEFFRALGVFDYYTHSSGNDVVSTGNSALVNSNPAPMDDGYIDLIIENVDATHANITVDADTVFGVATNASGSFSAPMFNSVTNGMKFNLKAFACGLGTLT